MKCDHKTKREFVLTSESHGYRCSCGEVFDEQHDPSQDSFFGVNALPPDYLIGLCGVDAFKIDLEKAIRELYNFR